MEWFKTQIPKPMAERIKKILPLGYSSIPQFVGRAVMELLEREEVRIDELRNDIRTGRKVQGKETDDMPF